MSIRARLYFLRASLFEAWGVGEAWQHMLCKVRESGLITYSTTHVLSFYHTHFFNVGKTKRLSVERAPVLPGCARGAGVAKVPTRLGTRRAVLPARHASGVSQAGRARPSVETGETHGEKHTAHWR